MERRHHLITLQDLLALCQPKLVFLLMLTAWVSMLISEPWFRVAWQPVFFGSLGIALLACSVSVINQLFDRRVNALMARTKYLPLSSGRVSSRQAILLAASLFAMSVIIFLLFVNLEVAILGTVILVGYAGVHSIFYKKNAPRHIFVRALAGAMPPLLGWAVMVGHVDPASLLLVLIVFAWAPPHFWALMLARREEYARANAPILPVTHGVEYTRTQVQRYTLFLMTVSYLPIAVDFSGLTYGLCVTLLNFGYMVHMIRFRRHCDVRFALRLFSYSIFYLSALFLSLLADHFFPILH